MKRLILSSILIIVSVYCFSQNITITRTTMTDACTLGYMAINGKTIVYTLEEPWHDNIGFISCVPEGLYDANIRFDKPDRWRIELLNVPKRGGVQIHIGNDTSDIEGCILVGTGVNVNECYLTGSKAAFNLMTATTQFTNGQKLTVRFINPTLKPEHKYYSCTQVINANMNVSQFDPLKDKYPSSEEGTLTIDGNDVKFTKKTRFKANNNICVSSYTFNLKDFTEVEYYEQKPLPANSGFLEIKFRNAKTKCVKIEQGQCLDMSLPPVQYSNQVNVFICVNQKDEFLRFLRQRGFNPINDY